MDGIAHAFSPINGESTGTVIAQESPLQKGKILRPYNALFDAPPKTGPRECAVFAHGAILAAGESRDTLVETGAGNWSVEADYRAVALYSTVTGLPIGIDAIGTLPDPALMTELPRPSAQHTWEAGAWVRNPALVATAVKSDRNTRLLEARAKMAPLQDAIDIGEATTDETALLIKWKQYTSALNRIEQQAGFPLDVAWPPAPDVVINPPA